VRSNIFSGYFDPGTDFQALEKADKLFTFQVQIVHTTSPGKKPLGRKMR
jgi:hypothetical protein